MHNNSSTGICRFCTGVNPSGLQSCTAGPFEHINLVNKATPTAMQELAAAVTSPEPPNVENSQLTCEAVLPTGASIQTEVMEVDDLSGHPSHNSVNAASDKVINLFEIKRGFVLLLKGLEIFTDRCLSLCVS